MYAGPHNNTNVWTYSGTTFRGNQSFGAANETYANQYPLWSFDNATKDWNQFDLGQLKTPSYGLSAEAPDQGLAFYLNGQTDNGTEPNSWADGDVTTLLNGMMVIDLAHQTSKNISTSSLQDAQPRVGGTMQYVPNVGNDGVLIALGGKVYDGLRTLTSQDKGRLLKFDTVDVFDISSYVSGTKKGGTWYQQPTSGEIPPPRIDTCTVIASAPDNSTYNIYMYGGWDPTGDQQKWYDDIYVLSLPSFTWVKMYEAESPRSGHTCHLVGRQLLTIGGNNVRRNLTGMCDWETESIAVLDLPTMTWGSVFNASHGTYELSKGLVDKVGGTNQGGSTMQVPVNGWSSKELGTIMNTTRIYSDVNGTIEVIRPIPTNTGMSSKTRLAIIVGVTVTGLVLIACAAWIIYLCRGRRSHAGRVELSSDSGGHSSIHEIDELAKHELSPDEKKVYELTGEDWRYEAPDTLVRAEADGANATTRAFELPTTNFGEHGRWGVPIVKEPTPCASRRGSAAMGGTSVTVISRKSSSDMV